MMRGHLGHLSKTRGIPRGHRPLLLLGVVGLAAAGVLSTTLITTGSATGDVAPLLPSVSELRLGPPPERIPVALLQNGSADGTWLLQRGMLFNYRWLLDGRIREREAEWPPWPREATQPIAPFTISLQTGSVPDDVVVKIFDASRMRRGIPSDDPIDEINCAWDYDHAPDCLLQLNDGSLGVELPSLPRARGYRIVVFGSWLYEQRSEKDPTAIRPTHLTASWLFSLGAKDEEVP